MRQHVVVAGRYDHKFGWVVSRVLGPFLSEAIAREWVHANADLISDEEYVVAPLMSARELLTAES